VFHAAVIKRIVNRHDCAARIAENRIDLLRSQRMYHPLCSIHSYIPVEYREKQNFMLIFISVPDLRFLVIKKPPDLSVRGS
jgi:hypothetical protein